MSWGKLAGMWGLRGQVGANGQKDHFFWQLWESTGSAPTTQSQVFKWLGTELQI